MTHYIAHMMYRREIHYLTPRRDTERRYESRSGWEPDIDNARVFNTKAAATNSARQSLERGEEFTVSPVYVVVRT